MQEGDIAIASIQLPGYGDFLVCAISTQLRQLVPGFDEVLQPNIDYAQHQLSDYQI